jgi:hypothetical protein
VQLITTYYYYDCPVLFSCKHKSKFYIGTLIEPPFFVYAQVTAKILRDLEKEIIDLRTLFTSSKLFVGGLLDENIIKLEGAFPEKWLPESGVYLTSERTS